jgi:hypothetical protein
VMWRVFFRVKDDESWRSGANGPRRRMRDDGRVHGRVVVLCRGSVDGRCGEEHANLCAEDVSTV